MSAPGTSSGTGPAERLDALGDLRHFLTKLDDPRLDFARFAPLFVNLDMPAWRLEFLSSEELTEFEQIFYEELGKRPEGLSGRDKLDVKRIIGKLKKKAETRE